MIIRPGHMPAALVDAQRERATFVHREIHRRVELAKRHRGNVAAQRATVQHLRHDFTAFVRDWCWTYDPRARAPSPKRLPFHPWEKQAELLVWMEEQAAQGVGGVVKKGRDVGVTWLFIYRAIWRWLFHGDVTMTFGSRKASLVDELGDLGAIFPRIELALQWLPLWMLPPGFDLAKHRKLFQFINPATGALITGEGGDEMGRGKRATEYMLDEWAFVDRADKVNAAVTDVSDIVWKFSTSNGLGTQMYRDETSGYLPVFRLNYLDDPWKPDEAFRLHTIGRLSGDETTFAREHEMDDAAALEGLVMPARWVNAAVGLDLEPGAPAVGGLDIATVGKNLSVLVPRRGPAVGELHAWQGANMQTNAQRAATIMRRERLDTLNYDGDGVGSGIEEWFLLLEQGRRERGQGIGAPFRRVGIRGGAAASTTRYTDAPQHDAKARFLNRRAELWYSVRMRFQRTHLRRRWEATEGLEGYWYDDDACISIPDDQALRTQLSTPQLIHRPDGKIAIEGKESMSRRGVASPDHADALIYSFAPTPVSRVYDTGDDMAEHLRAEIVSPIMT